MPLFRSNEGQDRLWLAEDELVPDDGETFLVLATRVAALRRSELPVGYQVQLRDHAPGRRYDMLRREPYTVFGHSTTHGLTAAVEVSFAPPSHRVLSGDRAEHFARAIAAMRQELYTLRAEGQILEEAWPTYTDRVYFTFTVRLQDQTFAEAERSIGGLVGRIAAARHRQAGA